MEHVRQQSRFSIAVHVYLWLSLASIGFLPIFVMVTIAYGVRLPHACWLAAGGWPALVAMLLVYARHRCSSETMTFRDGLLWTTWSMMTGWMYQSFFSVGLGLSVAFCAGLIVSITGDLRRNPDYAPHKWRLIVKFFYHHRMRQPAPPAKGLQRT